MVYVKRNDFFFVLTTIGVVVGSSLSGDAVRLDKINEKYLMHFCQILPKFGSKDLSFSQFQLIQINILYYQNKILGVYKINQFYYIFQFNRSHQCISKRTLS